MRMQMTSQIDAGGNDPIFLMFHGYGNDESEMVRILDAVYAPTRADAAPAAIAAVPSYISFRATYARPYMGGNYWYPDGCGVDERQRECAAVGDAVASLLDASAFALLSPSFMGEEQAAFDSPTRFFLAYGAQDRTIPLPDQQTAHQVLERAGHLTYREYSGMAHAICDEEIADIRDFLRAI